MSGSSRLTVGLLPLADAAPLLVARECGYFARHGLDVSLSVEASWAGLRDKLAAGMLDAAALLAPMPLAAQLGLDQLGVPIETALTLSRNGNAITVSLDLHARLDAPVPEPQATGAALRRVIDEDQHAGRPRRVFAHVFPYSSHHYLLRDWLRRADIDPDRDVKLVVVPPPLVLKALKDGRIDGYCVGAPWGRAAELEGVGRRLLATHTIRPGCAEKVLGVTRDWAERHPARHLALVAALIDAGRWLEQPGNRTAAGQMLVDARLIDAPPQCLRDALRDDHDDLLGPQFVFGAGGILLPNHQDARWFLDQMRRCGQLQAAAEGDEAVLAGYRLATHREASMMATAVSLPSVQ